MINNCVFKTSYMSFFLVQSKVPKGGYYLLTILNSFVFNVHNNG